MTSLSLVSAPDPFRERKDHVRKRGRGGKGRKGSGTEEVGHDVVVM